ncbi:MAG: hypothetical protein JWO76_2336 [Nocardioides sp.]|nr:hypothetical protein [Nocardioides sp.]
MRRALIIAAGAVTAAVLTAAPAIADDTVVVRGLDFQGGLTSLSITGCPGLFDRVAEPVTTYVSKSPDAPAGARSLKYDLAGGNAVGSQHAVASMTQTSVAGLSVFAPDGAIGVAYAGYRAPADWATSLIWVGRADLRAAPGGWQQVDATGLTYTWTQYDMDTRQPVAASDEPLTVAGFAAAHGGDGPGFWTVGFGCDGNPFKIDALRIGAPGAVTTYDLEGFTSTTAISGSRTSVAAGDAVTLAGTLRDGRGQALPHGLLVLEAQEYGQEGFRPVQGGAATVDAGDPTVTVRPSARTVYRWRFAGTWSVDGSLSPTFTVDVGTVVTAQTDDSRVEAGQPLAVVGTTTPAQPGVRATLWRLGAKGRVPVATTVVDGGGRFRFEVPADVEAPWRYVVTVPAAHGNLAGESSAQQVRVVR